VASDESRQGFFELIAGTSETLQGEEVLLASFAGERSDFVRFGGGRVRQAGAVARADVGLDLIAGERHAEATLTLTGEPSADAGQVAAAVERLRHVRTALAPDPFLAYATGPSESFEQRGAVLPAFAEIPALVERIAGGADLVGMWAQGRIERGFASSFGGRGWHEVDSFQVDASFHGRAGAAVKWMHAGGDWDEGALAAKADAARAELGLLERSAVEIAAGRYRAFLAPAALEEIFGLLAWEGFGLKSHRTRQTPFLKMVADGRELSPAVTLSDRRVQTPAFTAEGFRRPDEIVLIDRGRYAGCLASARSAKEYGVEVNADDESPQELEMAGGELDERDALPELGTGLLLSNLWYTNFSDRGECRITGMSRYACFWVEDGVRKAPLAPMRFDESLYHLLGSGLIALTSRRETLADADTYGGRSLRRALLPGALIDGLTIAL